MRAITTLQQAGGRWQALGPGILESFESYGQAIEMLVRRGWRLLSIGAHGPMFERDLNPDTLNAYSTARANLRNAAESTDAIRRRVPPDLAEVLKAIEEERDAQAAFEKARAALHAALESPSQAA